MNVPEQPYRIESFDVPPTERAKWITIFDSPYYPDFLPEREALHKPTLIEFRVLVEVSSSSEDLLRRIADFTGKQYIQLCRIFRKYVSPDTPVEMLKRKSDLEQNIIDFGARFRTLEEVKERLFARPEDDEVLFAILGEYDRRGDKGYTLTELFFDWFRAKFADVGFTIDGPTRAGADVSLRGTLPNYEHNTPADFVISYEGVPLTVGFARYDTDRGGSQEDDRTGGNYRHAVDVLAYAPPPGYFPLKVLFVNDGPGLLLGSMWRDYVTLEQIDRDRVMVCTLQMLDDRITLGWLLSEVTSPS